MKKNISINLQGLIFHIEEDGYDVLSRYLAEVKAHFSGYRGHEEIVADIEGRIAELFAARTSSTKQVITLDDVQAMVAKMGRVSDFQSADEAEEEEEALAGGPAAYTSYADGATAASAAPAAEPRRLYRDMNNRKIAGVAAGIAHYLSTNPLWIRLVLLGLFLLLPIVFDDTLLENAVGRMSGITFLSYVVLWIVLPKRYDALPSDEDQVFKKLYRDTDNGKVGGVSAGLAAYFRVDVVVIRVVFLALLLAGSLGFWLYVLLWVLLPEAKTASDKLRMRGDAVTLSALDENLRNNPYAAGAEGTPVNNRPVGTFLEDSFSNVRPVINGIGSVIRVVAGGILTLTGFGILLAVTIAWGVGLGVITSSDNLDFGPLQPFLFFNDISAWAMLSFFLLTAIPALALLLTGVGLLIRRTVLNRTASLSLLGLWLLGIVGSSVAGIRVGREFQREEEITQTTSLSSLTSNRLVLERRQQDSGRWVDLDLVGIDSTQAPRLERIIAAKGSSDSIARRNAATSTLHTLRILNDSTLSVDDHFTFQPSAKFRDQQMRLRLLLPRGRAFRMTETFADWLDEEDYVNSQAPIHPEKFVFRMQGNKVECVNCKPTDLREAEDNAYDDEDDQDDYEAGRNDSNLKLSFDRIEPIKADESAYGSDRQSFSEADFDRISVVGGYRVLIRQGSSYSVRAAGPGRALRDLEVEREGNELTIRPRNRDLFDSDRNDTKQVLLTIETPELNELQLVGGTHAEVSGFGTGDLRVQQAGGSQFRFRGNLQELKLELAGGCQAALQGNADRLKIGGAGACEVAATEFNVREADVDAIGATKVRLRVTDKLKANAVGASLIEYSGRPETVRREAVGAATIRSLE